MISLLLDLLKSLPAGIFALLFIYFYLEEAYFFASLFILLNILLLLIADWFLGFTTFIYLSSAIIFFIMGETLSFVIFILAFWIFIIIHILRHGFFI